MSGIDEGLLKVFLEEVDELTTDLEEALMELDDNREDTDLINRIFRSLHTIKGSSGMYGFDNLSKFLHNIETIYDKIRNAELKVNKNLIDITLKAKDFVRELVSNNDQYDQGKFNNIIQSFKSFAGEEDTPKSEKPKNIDSAVKENKESPKNIFRIRFKPSQNIFFTGTNPISLIDELKHLGESYIFAYNKDLPSPEYFDPEKCYIYWDILLLTDKKINDIKDVFIFVEDESDIKIDLIEDESEIPDFSDADTRKLGEILVEKGDITYDDLNSIFSYKKKIGEELIEKGLVSGSNIKSALLEQELVKKQKEIKKETLTTSSVRVSSDKLDKLVDLVGELVIAQTRLEQLANNLGNSKLNNITEEIERLSLDLRQTTLGIRMVQIGSSFGKFRRIVRDLSSEMGKKVEFITIGEETELDKTVIEKLNNPLVHILRNSIDHGIEPPEDRISKGKSEKGKVILKAEHSGGNVIITISDDGKGINVDKVIEKAEKLNLISTKNISKDEALYLIFHPGLSTAEKITNVSGRGVGMDVVRQDISSLRGEVKISSEQGKGTSIKIILPLTLAIIEGLIFKIKDNSFIIPLSFINECIEYRRVEYLNKYKGNFVDIRGKLIPFVVFRDYFKIQGERPDIEQIIIVSLGDEIIGLAVDEIIGQQQIVIKNLGSIFKNIRAISGAAIQGDGTMALIVDISGLISEVKSLNMLDETVS